MDHLTTMDFDLQPGNLQNELVTIRPVKINDFERLYQVASDPLIWEQHPTTNRYKREVFEQFFDAAIKSESAFIVFDTNTDEPIGSSRFYEYDKDKKTIAVGYTFLARAYWGTRYNRALKSLMLNYAFNFVNTVIFHIGTDNIRSQKAIEKLGAKKIEQVEIKYYEDQRVLHYVYQIDREAWRRN